MPHVDLCKDLNDNLLTDGSKVINSWMQYYDEHANDNSANKYESRTNQGTLTHVKDMLPTPNLQPIREKIGSLRINRAAAKNQLTCNLFKYWGAGRGTSLGYLQNLS